MVLTDEQKATIARNREEALKKAALRMEREKKETETRNLIKITEPKKPEPLRPAIPSVSQVRQVWILRIGFFLNVLSLFQPMKTATNSMNKQSSMIAFVQRPEVPSHSKTTVEVKLKIDTAERIRVCLYHLSESIEIATFQIEFYPFHSAVIDLIKQIPSRNYDPNKRIWTCSVNDLNTVSNIMKNATAINVQLETLPQNVIGMLNYKPKAAPEDLSKVMDPTLIDRLFPYQKDGVRFALERDGRVLLADEMGLGKSVQALTIARYYK